MHQPILIPSEDEAVLLGASSRFRELGEDERRFAVAWIQQATAHRQDAIANPLSAAAVAARAGIGRTKGYELARRPAVLEAIRQGAQAHSDLTDVVGSAALDLVVRRIWERLTSGLWTVHDVPPHLIKVLQDCKARLGLQPPGSAGINLSLTDAAGNRAELGVSATGDDASSHVAELMSKLRGGANGTAAAAGEADRAESVRGENVPVERDASSGAGSGIPSATAVEAIEPTETTATAAAAFESGAAAGPGCPAQQLSSIYGPAATLDSNVQEVDQ